MKTPPKAGFERSRRGPEVNHQEGWKERAWRDARALWGPLFWWWTLLCASYAAFSGAVLIKEGPDPEGLMVLGMLGVVTLSSVAAGQLMALLRVRDWLVFVIWAVVWVFGGFAGLLGAGLSGLAPLMILVLLYMFFGPMFLLGGLWSLKTGRDMAATWVPLVFVTGAVILVAEAQGTDALWFAGQKWAAVGPIGLGLFTGMVVMLIAYLAAREAHRLYTWRNAPGGLLPSNLNDSKAAPRLGCGGWILLLLLSGGLGTGSSLLGPYLWRSEVREDGHPKEGEDPKEQGKGGASENSTKQQGKGDPKDPGEGREPGEGEGRDKSEQGGKGEDPAQGSPEEPGGDEPSQNGGESGEQGGDREGQSGGTPPGPQENQGGKGNKSQQNGGQSGEQSGQGKPGEGEPGPGGSEPGGSEKGQQGRRAPTDNSDKVVRNLDPLTEPGISQSSQGVGSQQQQPPPDLLSALLSALVLFLIGLVLFWRPVRRLLLVRHLKRPWWRRSGTSRLEGGWRLLELALEDAGCELRPGEPATALVERVRVDLERLAPAEVQGLLEAAQIRDRVTYGLGVAPQDLVDMGEVVERAYETIWDRLGDWRQIRALYRGV